MPMASFEDILSDHKLAELITFVRSYLGAREKPVTAEDVKSVREQLEKVGYTEGYTLRLTCMSSVMGILI
ncbi:putative diheme cytochrome c-553 [Photobacterium aphoticum]|uniref:Putative diheme cytochrome c-553 n=1 Tax=Photobacterium aphoticum TaxID=754436 RepID=A0A090QJT3_9GAMM|nr:putative diheme cytochrome c-553 [Photobacterium aphoticum]